MNSRNNGLKIYVTYDIHRPGNFPAADETAELLVHKHQNNELPLVLEPGNIFDRICAP
jgi:hypothetical protein